MEKSGPSWWQTRVITPEVNGEMTDVQQTTWYTLFECFRQNANRYAVLRISVSNGGVSYVGSHNDEEIFIQNTSAAKNAAALVKSLMNVVDTTEGAIRIEMNEASRPGVTVCFSSEAFKVDVRLEASRPLESQQFLDRTMAYLANTEADLQEVRDNVSILTQRRQELVSKVEKSVQNKLDDDGVIERGLRVLMKEKRNYWKDKS